MNSYKILVEDMNDSNCAKTIRKALESNNIAVSVNLPHKEICIDTDVSVADVYEIIENAGFTPTDLELI